MGEWIERLQREHPFLGEGTDRAVLQAVQDGIAQLEFATIDASFGGHSAKFQVFRDALRVDGVRVAVSAACSERIAGALGCALITPKISDLIWAQARQLAPRPRGLWLAGNALQIHQTLAMVEHSRALDALGAHEGLLADVGKDWCMTNLLVNKPEKACNYGWHVRGQFFAGLRAHASATLEGAFVVQPLGTVHNRNHVDYSQTVRLVRLECTVDGRPANLLDLLRDPELAGLASHEGPLRTLELALVPGSPTAPAPTSEPALDAEPPPDAWRDHLRLNMRGADVAAWMRLLERAGHSLPASSRNEFDHFVDRETRLWQRARGIEPDGDVGPATRRAIGQPAQPGLVPGIDTSAPIGERALVWSLQETEAYRGKPPPPERIAFYLSDCQREKPAPHGPLTALPLPASANFCAAAACKANRAVAADGDVLPHHYRASGLELQRDAMSAGHWTHVRDVQLGRAVPRRGDLVILTRPGESWFRHVSRVLEYDSGTGSMTCIDANASGRVWAQVTRSITNERVLGFIGYPRLEVDNDTSALDTELLSGINSDPSPDLNGPVTKVVDTAARVTGAVRGLREAEIDCVIRYYTKNPESHKLLRVDEALAICDAGLSLAVVYQDNGSSVAHFNRELGNQAGRVAVQYATTVIGQPRQSAIYFAVDFDASDADVVSHIAPHFEGIRAAMAEAGDHYRVGVYGSGLVCSSILDRSLATLGWISNARSWRGSAAFEQSGRWSLLQHLPTTMGGLPFDPNDVNSDSPDFGAFRIEKPASQVRFEVVSPAGLRVRSGPGTSFDIVDVLPVKTEVRVGRKAAGWVEVDRTFDGPFIGWCFADFLKAVG